MREALEQGRRFAESPTGQKLRELAESPTVQRLREQLRWTDDPTWRAIGEQARGMQEFLRESPTWREVSDQMRMQWFQQIDAEIEAEAKAGAKAHRPPSKRKPPGRKPALTAEKIEKGISLLSSRSRMPVENACDFLRRELKLKISDASNSALYRSVYAKAFPPVSK
jgi:hypothetical protein